MNEPSSGVSDSTGKVTFETRAFIDGRFVPAASGKTFSTITPATGRKLADVAECDKADIYAAVFAARRSFEAGAWSGWSSLSGL